MLELGPGNAVRGLHFKAYELVRLVFVSDKGQIRRVRAGAHGSFAYLLPAQFDYCSGLVVRAAGSRGDLAVMDVPAASCPAPVASAEGSTASGGSSTAKGGTAVDGEVPPSPGPPNIHR
jgi:hypothetical protein